MDQDNVPDDDKIQNNNETKNDRTLVCEPAEVENKSTIDAFQSNNDDETCNSSNDDECKSCMNTNNVDNEAKKSAVAATENGDKSTIAPVAEKQTVDMFESSDNEKDEMKLDPEDEVNQESCEQPAEETHLIEMGDSESDLSDFFKAGDNPCSFKLVSDGSKSSDSESQSKDDGANEEQSSSQQGEGKKRKSEEGESNSTDDEYMDAQGDGGEPGRSRSSKKLRRFLWGTASSSDSDDISSGSDSSSDKSSNEDSEKKRTEKVEEESWLKRDVKPLPSPRWRSTRELRRRETLRNSSFWPVKVCGSQAMVRRFRLQSELDKHRGCVNALHFNQSGTLIASGSDDLRVMLWDWVNSSNHPAVNYESGHKSNVFQAKFLPNCNDATVVSSARDGQVRVADISSTGSCRGTKKIAQHRGSAHKLAIDADARSTFLSCGEDGVVFGIDLRSDKPAEKLVTIKADNKKVPLYSIHSNPLRPYEFAVSGREENARVYDRRMLGGDDTTTPVKLYCPHHLQGVPDTKANITCLVYNWNGSELLCSYNDEDIYLFDTSHSSGADYIKRYKGHRNNATVKGINFYGPYSEFVVSGSDCGNVFFWEKESSRIVSLVEGDKGGVVNVLEPHPNLPVIATSGLDRQVKIWTPSGPPDEDGKLAQLHSLMLTNRRDREEERRSMPDMIDGHMLWYLMRTLRSRHRMRFGADNDSSSDGELSSSDSSSGSSEESDRMSRCVQS